MSHWSPHVCIHNTQTHTHIGVGWGGVGYIFQKESVPLLGLPAGLIYPDWN